MLSQLRTLTDTEMLWAIGAVVGILLAALFGFLIGRAKDRPVVGALPRRRARRPGPHRHLDDVQEGARVLLSGSSPHRPGGADVCAWMTAFDERGAQTLQTLVSVPVWGLVVMTLAVGALVAIVARVGLRRLLADEQTAWRRSPAR